MHLRHMLDDRQTQTCFNFLLAVAVVSPVITINHGAGIKYNFNMSQKCNDANIGLEFT